MKSILITITPNGWKATVRLGDNEFSETHIATPTGSKSTKRCFEDSSEISDKLEDALSGFAIYDMMKALDENEL